MPINNGMFGSSSQGCMSRSTPGDPSSLRFTVGTLVLAQMGHSFDSYEKGVIIKLWDDGHPYRIRLDSGHDVWAEHDENACVRLRPKAGASITNAGRGVNNVSTPLPSGLGSIDEKVRVGKDPKDLRVCASCGSPNNLKRCARCKQVSYCSHDCQVKSWRSGGHSKVCKQL